MGYSGRGPSTLKQLLRTPWAAVVGVTLLTVLLGVGVAVTATPAGCGLGLRFNASCSNKTAAVVTPSPRNSTPPYVYSPPPASSLPSSPSVSPTALPSPTHNPALPPYEYDASQAYVPQYSFASAGEPMPADINLTCRLPIYAGPSGSGGFIVYPDRTFIADPRSAVSLPSPSPGPSPAPGTPNYGYGFIGLAYDQAHDKWVPVRYSWISPDGARYAFPSQDGISVVGVSDGTLVKIGSGRTWSLVGVVDGGVYVEPGTPSGLGPGLWFLPWTGPEKQVTTSGFWQGVGGGAAYGTVTSAVPQGVANTIVRLDLTTGQSQPWFMVDGSQSNVIGFDAAGSPVMAVGVLGGQQLWLAPGLAAAFPFVSAYVQGVVGDSHGIWVSTGQVISLFVAGRGTFETAAIGGNLAGPCR